MADGYLSRLVGLLGRTKRWAHLGAGLWIVPSRGVHTIGMLFAIDLVFLNKEKEVVHVEEVVRPFRISKVSFKAGGVLELPPTLSTVQERKSEIASRSPQQPRRRKLR